MSVAVKQIATTGEIIERLSDAERQELIWREEAIERGLETFIEVGMALAAIRAKRLYREDYARWDDYVERRWGITHGRASQLINGTETALHIAAVTSVTLPNEATVRALRRFDAEMQPMIARFARAFANADGRQITSGDIKDIGEALVATEAAGGMVDIGDGERGMVALYAMLKLVIEEKKKRQQQHISDGSQWEQLASFEGDAREVIRLLQDAWKLLRTQGEVFRIVVYKEKVQDATPV